MLGQSVKHKKKYLYALSINSQCLHVLFSFVVLHRDTSGPVEVLSVESVSSRRPPDVVRALLSILELEGPLLTTVGAQL